MPTPTLAINSVEIRIAMYCLKRSIFNIYNAGASHTFNIAEEPGYWLTRNPGETTLTVITDPSVFPESAAPISTTGGRTPTDVTAYFYRNMNFRNAVENLLSGISTTPITEGGGSNNYWAEAIAAGVGAVVVPKGASYPRPTNLLVWHRITYSVNGIPANYTVSGVKEISLAGIYDYPINDTLCFPCLNTAQGGMYTDFSGSTPVASPMTSPTIAIVRGFAAFRGLSADAIARYMDVNSAPFIKVGVRCHSGDDSTVFTPTYNSYQQLTLIPQLSTSLTLGSTTFSIGNQATITPQSRYYPHTFYMATLILGDPAATTSMNLPRTIPVGDTHKLVDGFTPSVCLRDLTSMNSEGAELWTNPDYITIPLATKIHATFADPNISLRKKGAFIYGGLGNTTTKNIPVLLSNPSGQTTITVAQDQYWVEIPANAQVKVINALGSWETFGATNSAPIVLSGGLSRPQFTVVGGTNTPKDIPFRLTNATTTLMGITIPTAMQLNPIRLPISTHISYTQSGSNYAVDMPGFLYLLAAPQLVDLSVGINPNNTTQATGWRFGLIYRIYLMSDFGLTDFEALGSGYFRRTLNISGQQPNALTQLNITSYPAGIQSEDGEWLRESYDLTPGRTLTLVSGTNNFTVVVPEDLTPAATQNILTTFYNYLAGATGTLDVRYPFNMDDSMSSIASISIPNP